MEEHLNLYLHPHPKDLDRDSSCSTLLDHDLYHVMLLLGNTFSEIINFSNKEAVNTLK